MTNYIANNRYRGLLFAITSMHTPGMAQPKHLIDANVSTETWSTLTDQIAAIGSREHEFNTAASTPGSDYSLIGYPSYRGGVGSEVIGPNARIRGGLAPDQTALFAPMGVTTNGRLTRSSPSSSCARPIQRGRSTTTGVRATPSATSDTASGSA